jgi:hypothetical protein
MRVVLALATTAALLAIAAPAQAESRTIEVAAFHAINAEGPFRVNYTPNARASVFVRGADLDRVRIRVVNGVLRISQRCTFLCISNRGPIAVIEAASPSIDSFSASKGAEAYARGVRARNFDASASMGGNLTVAGSCDTLDASVSMGGVLTAKELRCASASVSASMGGIADVHANGSVRASASMGGTIDVSGAPQERHASSSMGGTISIE